MIDTVLTTLISKNVQLSCLEPHIYSVYSADSNRFSYDSKVAFYDRIIGARWYNHFMWGNSPTDYADFCLTGITSSKEGWILDAGCGSLIFTSKIYAGYLQRPIILLDQSFGMLKAAKAKLIKIVGQVPNNVFLLQGDIFQLPFQPQCFQTILSMGILHLFTEQEKLLHELHRTLNKNGKMFFTSLITNNRRGDHYLDFLYRQGEVASPKNTESLLKVFDTLNMPIGHNIKGNMAYIVCG